MLQATHGLLINLRDTLHHWIHQDQHTAPGTTLNAFHVAFTIVTCAALILPGVYLSDISDINLKKIFLLFFTPTLCRQYANVPFTNLSSNSIVGIVNYMSTAISNKALPTLPARPPSFANSNHLPSFPPNLWLPHVLPSSVLHDQILPSLPTATNPIEPPDSNDDSIFSTH